MAKRSKGEWTCYRFERTLRFREVEGLIELQGKFWSEYSLSK